MWVAVCRKLGLHWRSLPADTPFLVECVTHTTWAARKEAHAGKMCLQACASKHVPPSTCLQAPGCTHVFLLRLIDTQLLVGFLAQTSVGLQAKLRRGMFQLLERPPRMLPRIFNPVQLNVDCSAKTPVKEPEGKKARRGRGPKVSGASKASKASGEGSRASRPASAAATSTVAGQILERRCVCKHS